VDGYFETPEFFEADGLVYGEDFGQCDICNKCEPWEDLTPNWNGETGNHFSCEAGNV